MNIVNVTNDLQRSETEVYDTRQLREIKFIAIHHSDAPGTLDPAAIAKFHVKTRQWPGIGYHFYIKSDGTVYQTNKLETVSWNVYRNNRTLVGVCLGGDFTSNPPTQAQLRSARKLIKKLQEELNIADQNVKGHREFPMQSTDCPGKLWPAWRDDIVGNFAVPEPIVPETAAPEAIEEVKPARKSRSTKAKEEIVDDTIEVQDE